MLKFLLHIILTFSTAFTCVCQVESSQSIKLTHSNNRQIYNLGSAESDSAAINIGDFVTNKYHFSIGTFDSDTLVASIDGPLTDIPEGYHLYFKASTSNPGKLFIKINNLNPVEVKKNVSKSLSTEDVLGNNIYLVVYDGANFQLLNPSIEKCPSGYVAVNERYCIQINENQASNFHDAIIDCGDQDANLCSIHQWVNACEKLTSLQNMTDNFEWVNDAGNQINQAKVFGENPSGINGCEENYTKAVDDNILHNYRCCYNRK